jgi:DNA-binding response OmpR family regulator
MDDPSRREGPSYGAGIQDVGFMIKNSSMLSRDQFLNEVWGYRGYPTTRTLDNHILKLRQKLESNPSNPSHFLTIHGMGYKFVP